MENFPEQLNLKIDGSKLTHRKALHVKSQTYSTHILFKKLIGIAISSSIKNRT